MVSSMRQSGLLISLDGGTEGGPTKLDLTEDGRARWLRRRPFRIFTGDDGDIPRRGR